MTSSAQIDGWPTGITEAALLRRNSMRERMLAELSALCLQGRKFKPVGLCRRERGASASSKGAAAAFCIYPGLFFENKLPAGNRERHLVAGKRTDGAEAARRTC